MIFELLTSKVLPWATNSGYNYIMRSNTKRGLSSTLLYHYTEEATDLFNTEQLAMVVQFIDTGDAQLFPVNSGSA